MSKCGFGEFPRRDCDRFRIATAIAIELQDAGDEAIAIEVHSAVDKN
jgi:hypothetical protein